MDVARLRAAIHLESAAIAPHTSALIEAAKEAANEIERLRGECEADAKRFLWLLAGHGYFMEERALCGHAPTSEDEQCRARLEIDRAMERGE